MSERPFVRPLLELHLKIIVRDDKVLLIQWYFIQCGAFAVLSELPDGCKHALTLSSPWRRSSQNRCRPPGGTWRHFPASDARSAPFQRHSGCRTASRRCRIAAPAALAGSPGYFAVRTGVRSGRAAETDATCPEAVQHKQLCVELGPPAPMQSLSKVLDGALGDI